MIYIRIELWPKGDRTKAELYHEGVIANVGTGSTTVGNYTYAFSKRGGFEGNHFHPREVAGSTLRKGLLNGFARGRGSAWDLLLLALTDALGGRVGKFIAKRPT